MRGAVAVTGSLERFSCSKVATSSPHTASTPKVAEHHFCTVCGIYTHHKRRSNPGELGVNVACLEGVSPFDFPEFVVYDGNRHPGDNPDHRTYRAGVLRFEPASDA